LWERVRERGIKMISPSPSPPIKGGDIDVHPI